MKQLVNNIKNKVKVALVALHQWALSHPDATRAIHTVWQSIAAYLIVTLPHIHTPTDVKVAAGGAIAAGLSKAKSTVWPLAVAWASSKVPHIVAPVPAGSVSSSDTQFIAPENTSPVPAPPAEKSATITDWQAERDKAAQVGSDAPGQAPDPTPPRATSSRAQ